MSIPADGVRISYFPPNMAWGVTYGDSVVPIDGKLLWMDKKELIDALERQGLVDVGTGILRLKEKNNGPKSDSI